MFVIAQCLKIIYNDALEFFTLDIFYQFLSYFKETCLVTLFDKTFRFSKTSQIDHFWAFFNELLQI